MCLTSPHSSTPHSPHLCFGSPKSSCQAIPGGITKYKCTLLKSAPPVLLQLLIPSLSDRFPGIFCLPPLLRNRNPALLELDGEGRLPRGDNLGPGAVSAHQDFGNAASPNKNILQRSKGCSQSPGMEKDPVPPPAAGMAAGPGFSKGQCQAKGSEVKRDSEQIPSQAGDGKNTTESGWKPPETTPRASLGKSRKSWTVGNGEMQRFFTTSFIFILIPAKQNSPQFLQFSCVLLKSGFEHFRLQALVSSGPFLLSPQTEDVTNTGTGLGIPRLGHSLPWIRPEGFSFQTGPSAGNDTSFLPPS